MRKDRKSIGIIAQVAIFFVLAALLTGIISFFAQREYSDRAVTQRMEEVSREITDVVEMSVAEYPAHEWLMRYWYRHADELDIEYDVPFDPSTETAQKELLFISRHPDIPIKYATTQQLVSIPREDQQLYAEITYSWLITRLNEIKLSYHMDFLFVVISDKPYDTQFFLLSAADPGAKRGTTYLEVYPLGTVSTVGEDQQNAMASALRYSEHLAAAGDYVDYYSYLTTFDNHAVFVGITYSVAQLRQSIYDDAGSSIVQAMIYQAILSALCLTMIFFFVLRPLKKVQKSIRSYTETKDSDRISRELQNDLKGIGALAIRGNEIGELSDDFLSMMDEIDDYVVNIETMTAETERISAELDLASKIQAAVLPSTFPAFPNRKEFDLYASMDPAKEVGGDFYDFFLIDDDHLCIEMADVSGKGVPAALFMMIAKSLIKTNALQGLSPSEVLTVVNKSICSNNPESMFVTVWMGILEISTGKLVAANGGHERPIIRRSGGLFEEYADKHGIFVGCMDIARYKNYELQLEPGDKIFLYTDGVPEAKNADEELFRIERALDAINANPDASPKEVLANVRSAVDAFVAGAEQFDDLTMLCLEYKGAGK